MRKNIIYQIVTSFLALLLAFLILNGLCYSIYWHPEKYFLKNLATDGIHKPNTPIVDGLEGYTILHTDSLGYINDKDLDFSGDYMVCFGSSDTLSKNVWFDEQYCTLLENKLKNDGINLDVYNAGFENQGLHNIISNFKSASQQFADAKMIVIETSWLPDKKDLLAAAEKLESGDEEYVPFNQTEYDTSISSFRRCANKISSLPYPRLLYSQITRIRKNPKTTPFVSFMYTKDTDDEDKINYDAYPPVLNRAFAALRKNAGDKPVVLLFNPYMKINKDGSMSVSANENIFKLLSKACSDNNIVFAETSQNNISTYENGYKVYRGFQNTSFPNGHINKYGHAVLADKLYEVICNSRLLEGTN